MAEKNTSKVQFFKNENRTYLSNLTPYMKDVLYILLWSGAIFALVKTGDGVYDTDRILWYSIGGILFSIIVMLLRKEHPLSIPNGIVAASYIGFVIYYFAISKGDWGPVYQKVLIVRFIYIGLLFMLGMNVLRTRKVSNLKGLDFRYVICVGVVLLLMLITDPSSIYYYLFPFVFLYLTPLSSEEWKKQELFVSIGIYLTFFFSMTISFIFYPDVFYDDGRFLGMFAYITSEGLLTSAGLMAMIYIFLHFRKTVKNKIILYVISALGVLYPVIVLIVLHDRSSYLGFLVLLYVLLAIRASKKSRIDVIYLLVVTFLLVLGAGLVFVNLMGKGDFSTFESILEKVKNERLHNSLYFVYQKTKMLSNVKSLTGVFAAGSVWNSLDRFFSYRLSLWVMAFKNAKLFGVEELGITFPNGMYIGHTHNFYVEWILKYGWVGGAALLTWFNWLLVKLVKGLKKGNRDILCSFVWSFFCLGFFIVEREPWNSLLPFMLLVLQYPVFFMKSDGTEALER